MPRKAPLPGDPNYRPAGGAGWGGPATGAGKPFGQGNQPSGDAKQAGKEARAAMRARMEEKRMAVADRLLGIALGETEGTPVQMSAINAVFDRLDGKPPQAITGADGGEQVTRVIYGWAEKPSE